MAPWANDTSNDVGDNHCGKRAQGGVGLFIRLHAREGIRADFRLLVQGISLLIWTELGVRLAGPRKPNTYYQYSMDLRDYKNFYQNVTYSKFTCIKMIWANSEVSRSSRHLQRGFQTIHSWASNECLWQQRICISDTHRIGSWKVQGGRRMKLDWMWRKDSQHLAVGSTDVLFYSDTVWTGPKRHCKQASL